MKILPRIIRPMSNVVWVMCRKTEIELTSVMFKRKRKEEKNSVIYGKKSLCPCPLEDPEGTEEVLFLDPQLPDFYPFSLFFLIDPGGVGASFYVSVHPSPSLSFLLFFFFETV